MKYSVLILMASCCRMAALYGNSYGTPPVGNVSMAPQYQSGMWNGAQQFDNRKVCFPETPSLNMGVNQNANLLSTQSQPGMWNGAQQFDNGAGYEMQVPVNTNGNDFFYGDFNYQIERDLQNKQKNLLNVRLLLQNSKRNYVFENGRLFRLTKQVVEEINPVDVIDTQKIFLLDGEKCFYDKAVLKFILCSSNEDMRELEKIVPEDDVYNMFVFDKDTARYFYVKRNENNLPVALVPLELMYKTKNKNGQESSFLKIVDSIYEVCDGKMIYIGTYREVESDCYVDTYGKVWQQDLYQGFNNYNSQQNQIMRVVDNYSQNMNIPNNVNHDNYVQQYPQQNPMLNNKDSNISKIMKLVDSYSDNINHVKSVPQSAPQKIQVTNFSGSNIMQSSPVRPNVRSKMSTLPYQFAKR